MSATEEYIDWVKWHRPLAVLIDGEWAPMEDSKGEPIYRGYLDELLKDRDTSEFVTDCYRRVMCDPEKLARERRAIVKTKRNRQRKRKSRRSNR